MSEQEVSYYEDMAPTEKYDRFMDVIVRNATASQTRHRRPASQGTPKWVAKVWWTPELQSKYNDKKVAFSTFKRIGGQPEYLSFKKAEASFKLAKRQTKRKKWQEYCSSLNKDSSLSDMYAMAKKYKGIPAANSVISADRWFDEFVGKLAPPNCSSTTGRHAFN